MQRTILAGVIGLLVLATPAQSAVTVRAEGFFETILPTTGVAATGAAVTKDGRQCAGNTSAAALDRAVAGDWDGTDFGPTFGVSVDRIKSLNLPFPSATYWNFDQGNVSQQMGACVTTATDGTEILFYEACASQTTACFTGKPLDVSAPAIVTTGVPFTISVREFDDFQDPAPSTPSANATLVGGGVSELTGASGTAQFTLSQPGSVRIVATKGRQVRDSVIVTVQNPPVYNVPTPTPTPTATAGPADTTAPVSTIKQPLDKRRYDRGGGPRELRARIVEAGGLASVKLGLFRKVATKCSAFDGKTEKFKTTRCGARPRFDVDAESPLTYLLPNRLGRGKYVFDLLATDAAGNREVIARGRNQVVFRVK